eukprot:Rmarinus@m.4495
MREPRGRVVVMTGSHSNKMKNERTMKRKKGKKSEKNPRRIWEGSEKNPRRIWEGSEKNPRRILIEERMKIREKLIIEIRIEKNRYPNEPVVSVSVLPGYFRLFCFICLFLPIYVFFFFFFFFFFF